MKRQRQSVTVKDVAKMAGVATSTVSLVLNDSPKVRPETKEKVLEAVKKLNYVPNNFAAVLRQGDSLSIGIIVPDMYNPFYWEIVKGLQEQCNECSIPVYVMETKYDVSTEFKQIQRCRSIRVNAFVFIGTENDSEIVKSLSKDSSNKIVFIDKIDPEQKIPYIVIDNYKSNYEAAEYLVKSGCKNIFYVTQSILTSILIQREKGAVDALKNYGLYKEENIIQVDDIYSGKMQSGYKIVDLILEKGIPDGILASSDQLALGILRGLYDHNLRIPEDVLLIGFDNIDSSKYSIPSLTTISQPREEMGKLAFAILTGKEGKGRVLAHEFIIRESVIKI